LIEFCAQLLVVGHFCFEAADHLAHSTAVLVAERTSHVNTAFAAKFDARPYLDAVVALGDKELLKPGAALFELLAASPVGGVLSGLATG